MALDHPVLVDLLRKAHPAEKAAAFAYQGHAASLRDPREKALVRQIEQDEWTHRRQVREIMGHYGIPVSQWYELKFHVVGRLISASCHVIGRFMPFYFAGRLESGNVCEYFRIRQGFHELGIRDHDRVMYEMGMKEKEHEVYFLDQVRRDRWLPFFERLFHWGAGSGFNDIDLERKYPVEESDAYCKA